MQAEISLGKFTKTKGQSYNVHLDGKMIVQDSHDEVYDACRVLRDLGITGRLEIWRWGSRVLVVQDIEKGAELAVQETYRVGPRVVKYRPFEKKS